MFLFLPSEARHPRAQQHGNHSPGPRAVKRPSDLARACKRIQALDECIIANNNLKVVYNVPRSNWSEPLLHVCLTSSLSQPKGYKAHPDPISKPARRKMA